MMHSLGGFGAERGDLPRSDGGQRAGREQQQQAKQKSDQTLVHGNRLLSGPGGKTESEGEKSTWEKLNIKEYEEEGAKPFLPAKGDWKE